MFAACARYQMLYLPGRRGRHLVDGGTEDEGEGQDDVLPAHLHSVKAEREPTPSSF